VAIFFACDGNAHTQRPWRATRPMMSDIEEPFGFIDTYFAKSGNVDKMSTISVGQRPFGIWPNCGSFVLD
jgi:hypothetical protein